MTRAETHRPGRAGRVMIWQDEKPVQVQMTWGLEPFEPHGKPLSLLRWEGREISNPCLIIANDFGLTIDGAVKYRARLVTDAPFFCIAGVWRPAKQGWPASYAALTTDAYPDLSPYKDRHGAVVREDDWIDWLTQARPVADILRSYPEGSFEVVGPRKRAPRPPAPPPVTRDLFDYR